MTVELIGDRSHGETWKVSAAPPDTETTTAENGGVQSGFIIGENEIGVWDVLTQPDGCREPQDLGDLLTALAASPELRSAAMLRSMERFRDQLMRLSTDTPLDYEIKITACDLTVVVRALLGRFR